MTANQKPDAELYVRCSKTRKHYSLLLKRDGNDAKVIGIVKVKTSLFSLFGKGQKTAKKIKFKDMIFADGIEQQCPYCQANQHFICDKCDTYSCLNPNDVHVCPECRNVTNSFRTVEEHTATVGNSQRLIGDGKSKALPSNNLPKRITKK